MIQDLFAKHKSSKDMLWDWLKDRQRAKTSEIIAWGLRNYSNRADRNARTLAREGKIRRMPQSKKVFYFGNTREEVWEVIEWPESCL